MSRSRKGMGVGQVFIYVLVALTFSVVLIFGYKSITGFLQRGEEVQFYQFKTDLESSIQRIYTEYGSIRQNTFYVPSQFTQICFVDVDQDPEERLRDKDPLAYDAWVTITEDAHTAGRRPYEVSSENVFLTPSAPEKMKVHQISIASGEGFLCLPVEDGAFTLIMEGKGDRTELSAG